jgi:hypothetical protein
MRHLIFLSRGEKIRGTAIVLGLIALTILGMNFFKIWYMAILKTIFHPSGIGIIALLVIAMVTIVAITRKN